MRYLAIELWSNSFNTLDCYYEPVAVSDRTHGLTYEDALKSLETLKYENLRESFKVAMNRSW